MERERRSRDYWREQLSEYWNGGLTIQEYCEGSVKSNMKK